MSYTNIGLPEKFVKTYIDPIVEDDSQGYTSRAELVKEAVRKFVNESKKNQQKED
jgi:metal-responsive CopG/Arc/MetJ family transcriptional regulator